MLKTHKIGDINAAEYGATYLKELEPNQFEFCVIYPDEDNEDAPYLVHIGVLYLDDLTPHDKRVLERFMGWQENPEPVDIAYSILQYWGTHYGETHYQDNVDDLINTWESDVEYDCR